jgi:hypothetical protein
MQQFYNLHELLFPTNLPLYWISYYLHFISKQTISLIYSRFSFGLSLLVGFLTHSCTMPHIQMSLILVTKLLIHLNNTNFLLRWTLVSWECVCIGDITHLVESPCPTLLDQSIKYLPLSTYFSSTTFSYLKALHNIDRVECPDAATSNIRALTQSQTQEGCRPNGYFWYLRQVA